MKHGDLAKIMLDQKSMHEHLTGNKQSQDNFIKSRANFIKQLAEQRNLGIDFELIKQSQNLTSKILDC